MRNKIILVLISFGVLVALCLLLPEENTTQNVIDNEQIAPVETIQDNSKSVIQIVHHMVSDNQVISKSASAVILHEDLTYYYAITNYHVLIKEGFETSSIDAVDYLGNTYQATKVLLSQAQEIVSEAYDLGLIKFEKSNISYTIPKTRVNTLTPSTLLTAVGYPNGERLSTNGYYEALVSNSSLPFYFIAHQAIIDNGNSGGGLFDLNGNIVGINVSASFDNEGLFVQGYAIPIDKVTEYLSLFNI